MQNLAIIMLEKFLTFPSCLVVIFINEHFVTYY